MRVRLVYVCYRMRWRGLDIRAAEELARITASSPPKLEVAVKNVGLGQGEECGYGSGYSSRGIAVKNVEVTQCRSVGD